MNNALFLKEWRYYLIELLPLIIKLDSFNLDPKLVANHFLKIRNTLLTSDLFFRRKTQVTLEQSSIKDSNHHVLKILGIARAPKH